MNTPTDSKSNPVSQHESWWLAITATVILAAIPNYHPDISGFGAYIGRVMGLAFPGFFFTGLAWAIRSSIGKPMTAMQFVRFFTGITVSWCAMYLMLFALP